MSVKVTLQTVRNTQYLNHKNFDQNFLSVGLQQFKMAYYVR